MLLSATVLVFLMTNSLVSSSDPDTDPDPNDHGTYYLLDPDHPFSGWTISKTHNNTKYVLYAIAVRSWFDAAYLCTHSSGGSLPSFHSADDANAIFSWVQRSYGSVVLNASVSPNPEVRNIWPGTSTLDMWLGYYGCYGGDDSARSGPGVRFPDQYFNMDRTTVDWGTVSVLNYTSEGTEFSRERLGPRPTVRIWPGVQSLERCAGFSRGYDTSFCGRTNGSGVLWINEECVPPLSQFRNTSVGPLAVVCSVPIEASTNLVSGIVVFAAVIVAVVAVDIVSLVGCIQACRRGSKVGSKSDGSLQDSFAARVEETDCLRVRFYFTFCVPGFTLLHMLCVAAMFAACLFLNPLFARIRNTTIILLEALFVFIIAVPVTCLFAATYGKDKCCEFFYVSVCPCSSCFVCLGDKEKVDGSPSLVATCFAVGKILKLGVVFAVSILIWKTTYTGAYVVIMATLVALLLMLGSGIFEVYWTYVDVSGLREKILPPLTCLSKRGCLGFYFVLYSILSLLLFIVVALVLFVQVCFGFKATDAMSSMLLSTISSSGINLGSLETYIWIVLVQMCLIPPICYLVETVFEMPRTYQLTLLLTGVVYPFVFVALHSIIEQIMINRLSPLQVYDDLEIGYFAGGLTHEASSYLYIPFLLPSILMLYHVVRTYVDTMHKFAISMEKGGKEGKDGETPGLVEMMDVDDADYVALSESSGESGDTLSSTTVSSESDRGGRRGRKIQKKGYKLSSISESSSESDDARSKRRRSGQKMQRTRSVKKRRRRSGSFESDDGRSKRRRSQRMQKTRSVRKSRRRSSSESDGSDVRSRRRGQRTQRTKAVKKRRRSGSSESDGSDGRSRRRRSGRMQRRKTTKKSWRSGSSESDGRSNRNKRRRRSARLQRTTTTRRRGQRGRRGRGRRGGGRRGGGRRGRRRPRSQAIGRAKKDRRRSSGSDYYSTSD